MELFGIEPPPYLPRPSVASLFANFWIYALIGGVIITLFYMIGAGLQWITSGGDKQKIEAAKSRLTYAILGLILLFLSYFLISLVYYMFGLSF